MAYEVAKAYVQIIASADGIKGQISDALNQEITDATDKGGSLMSKGMKTLGTVAAGALVASTAAAGKFAKDSVQTGMSFDAAMSQVAATMGTTVDQIQNLRDFAQEMGRSTSFSATQSGEAMNYMALAGYDALQTMQMLPSVLNLAASGNMGLARASDMVTDAQSALGLSFEETATMVDRMAKAASSSNTSVEQMGDAYLTVGGTAKNLNGGLLEMSTAIGILADNGIKGSEGGTALRNIILSLAAPTTQASAAMSDFGLSVFNAQGEMRPLNEIFADMNMLLGDMTQERKIGWIDTVFNKVDLKSVEALLANTATTVKDMNTALYDSGVDFDKIAESWEKLDGIETTAQQAQRAVKDLVGEQLSFGSTSEEIIQLLQESFGMTQEQAELAYVAINSTADAQKTMTTALQDSSVEWQKYHDQAWYANDGLDGLIEEIVFNLTDLQMSAEETAEYLHFEYGLEYEDAYAAIEAMSDVVTDHESRWAELSGKIDDSAGAAEKMANTQLDNLAGDITYFGSALEGAQIILSDQLTPTLREFVQFGTESITKVSDAFKEEGLAGAMEALGTALSDGLGMVVEMIPGFIDAGFQLLMALVKGIIDNAPTIFEAATACVASMAQGLGEALPELIPAAVGMILEIVDSLIDNADKLIDAALALAVGLAEGLIRSLPELVRVIPQLIQHLIEAFAVNAPKMLEAALKIAIALGAGLIEAIPEIIGAIPQIIAALIAAFIEGGPQMIEVGLNLIKGIGEGFVQAISWIGEKVREIVDAIVGAFKNLFGIHSPSTVFAEFGTLLILGLLQGIIETWHSVIDFFSGAWQAIVDGASALSEGISGAFTKAKEAAVAAWDNVSDLFAGVWENIQKSFDGIADWFQTTFESARDAAANAWATAKDAFAEAWSNIQGAFDGIADWFSETFTAAKEAAAGAWATATEAFSTVWQGIQGIFADVSTWFEGKFTEARERVANAWNGLQDKFSAVRDKIEGVFNGFSDWADRTSKAAMDRFAGAWNGIKSKFSTVWKSIKEAFNFKEAVQWGKDLISNFVSGITAAAGSVGRTLSNVGKNVKNLIGFSEPKIGPLSDFHTYAPDMMELFAKGIRDNTHLVQDTLSDALELDIPALRVPRLTTGAASGAFTSGGSSLAPAMQSAGATYNFYSPKALDPVSAMREAKKQSQRMAMAC